MAVRAILERSSDPRVERFLKVVQAAQIRTLTEILNDDMTRLYSQALSLEDAVGPHAEFSPADRLSL